MNIQQQIEKTITDRFNVIKLQIENESANHSGPATQSHFKLILVAQEFTNLSLLQRQRLVHSSLRELMPQFHALGLHTYSAEEWDKLSSVPQSPKCSGNR